MKAGLILLSLIVFSALLAPVISPETPGELHLEKQFAGPDSASVLGRDENGSDILTLLVYGARTSLVITSVTVLLCCVIGVVVGSLAGWSSRFDFLMRFADLLQAFPGFLLALALVAMVGPSTSALILALSFSGWTGYARLVRAEFLHLREKPFVQSARALGASPVRLIILHIWPNLAGLLLIHASFHGAGVVISESGLSFLGLSSATSVSWGSLISSGRYYLAEAPHITLFSAAAIMIFALALNLVGTGLRDKLDPKAL